MSLGAVATALLIPPANLPVAILAGFALSAWHRRLGLWLAVAATLALFGLSTPLVAQSLLVGLETGWSAAPSPLAPGASAPAAIVILGGDLTRVIDAAGQPSLGIGPLSLERVRAGAVFARATGLPVLITGGPPQPGGLSVGQVMADSLRDDFAVPPRWVETRSRDTWENAALSAQILRANSVTAVRLVTHPWHMPRSLLAFRAAGLTAYPASISLDAPPRGTWNELIPSAHAAYTSFFAFHEWIGIAYYRLR